MARLIAADQSETSQARAQDCFGYRTGNKSIAAGTSKGNYVSAGAGREQAPEVCNMAKFAGAISEEAKAFGIESLFPEEATVGVAGEGVPEVVPQVAARSESTYRGARRNAARDAQWGPKFDHAIALEFYSAIHPRAFILDYTRGRHVTSAEQFQALAQEADGKRGHLFFHVATLKTEWVIQRHTPKARLPRRLQSTFWNVLTSGATATPKNTPAMIQ